MDRSTLCLQKRSIWSSHISQLGFADWFSAQPLNFILQFVSNLCCVSEQSSKPLVLDLNSIPLDPNHTRGMSKEWPGSARESFLNADWIAMSCHGSLSLSSAQLLLWHSEEKRLAEPSPVGMKDSVASVETSSSQLLPVAPNTRTVTSHQNWAVIRVITLSWNIITGSFGSEVRKCWKFNELWSSE